VSESGDALPLTVTLSGTGIAPVLTLLNAAALDFGRQPVGTGLVKGLDLQNTGTGPLLLRHLTLAGEHAGDFAIDADGGPDSLAPGATRTLSLRFAPTSPGTREATLTLEDNAPGSPHTIALSGYATSP